MLIKQLHTEFLSSLNGGVNSEGLAFTNEIADGRSDHHELVSSDSAWLVGACQKNLT